MEPSLQNQQNPEGSEIEGTLAIDLGSSTTVVAFQQNNDPNPALLDLPPISRSAGEIPSLVQYESNGSKKTLIGQEVIEFENEIGSELSPYRCSDFKRWIGASDKTDFYKANISPEQAGELLIKAIWKNLPSNLKIVRLVLSAPVETYRSYRAWLREVCNSLPVSEIALVDEPTAAAMGAGLPSGAKLLVIDIGGSTIDFALVEIEGGEGKAEPIAQLMRFNGEDLEGRSNQILRCAKVLGKAGRRLGGRDIDRWIINHLIPDTEITDSLLNAAERLKCKLSAANIKSTFRLEEPIKNYSKVDKSSISLSRIELEELLIEKKFLETMELLLEKTIENGKLNGCKVEDIEGIVLVGGCSRIPLIKRWLKDKVDPIKLLTPPPIEAVAKGALKMTPGVTIRDLLQRGVSLRCWEKKSKKHIWHPLFIAGQPWPTTKPLEIVLTASIENQLEIELVLGEEEPNDSHEITYINGVPIIKEYIAKGKVSTWGGESKKIRLSMPAKAGEDCIRLSFTISTDCLLEVTGKDLRTGDEIEPQILGSIR